MKILILGGGISGLTAAWHLSKLCPKAEVTLLEQSSRLGGWIRTEQTQEFLFEQGPRTFSAARSPSLLRLIAEAGLENELLFSIPSAKKRYLWHRGKLKSAGALFLPHAWRLFLEPFISKGLEEETIHSFASRRFGARIAELFFDPLTLGIFAGDSRSLSMQACFPGLALMEEKHGSLLLGMLRRQKKRFPGSLFTLKNGMESLVHALSSNLKTEILLDTTVSSLKKEGIGWMVETNRGVFAADALFSALPAHALRSLLPSMPEIASASLTVVNLGFSKPILPKSGYGYLVPSMEKEDLLGMIFDSAIFGGNGCLMTAMVRPSSPCPEAVVLDALERHLKVSSSPDRILIHRAEQAIPQFALGQQKALRSWEACLSDLYLLGNYLDGPAVEQCIARSETMVNHFLEKKFQN